jgi:Kef-type K+ transport system membrane component KefB
MKWREASKLGVLMNARGLVELVVLNVGLDSGILPPAVFSMMVCMALFTTFITSPLLDLFEKKGAAVAEPVLHD